MSEIKVSRTEKPRTIPDAAGLGFGHIFADHMFVMDYETGKGWHNPSIIPYDEFCMFPSAMVLHYGQAIFEGMKAFRTADNEITLFRSQDYLNRFNRSAEILCIPQVDIKMVYEGLKKLIQLDKVWVPDAFGTSLYIRPFIFATDPYVGVKVSDTYKLAIILSPSGAYYSGGFDPVSIRVEDKFVRAVHGGLGEAKTPANYAASLRAQVEAKKEGFTQVLWLDAVERKYIEEVGTMNIFFKINGELITPALTGSILEEVFGSGTAAVISPVGELSWKGNNIVINDNKTGPLAQKLFDYVTGLQYGKVKDTFGWLETVAKI
ncbi:MAG: branched-chain amino acid aminotransferase [Firmicutes bacterium]|nr:branched-chain amino acid aminotransferase [Bacillota bacterium]